MAAMQASEVETTLAPWNSIWFIPSNNMEL